MTFIDLEAELASVSLEIQPFSFLPVSFPRHWPWLVKGVLKTKDTQRSLRNPQ